MHTELWLGHRSIIVHYSSSQVSTMKYYWITEILNFRADQFVHLFQHFQDGRRAQQHIESSWKQLESVSDLWPLPSTPADRHPPPQKKNTVTFYWNILIDLKNWFEYLMILLIHWFVVLLFLVLFRVNAGLSVTVRRRSELNMSLTELTLTTRRTEKRWMNNNSYKHNVVQLKESI